MNRYTPIPPIAPSAAEIFESESNNASSDDEDSGDEVLDEDFRLTNKQYDDVRPAMKKRMLALSQLDTFDSQVRNCPRYGTLIFHHHHHHFNKTD